MNGVSMNSFWSVWVIGLTAITLVGLLVLLLANRKIERKEENQKTGHEYDGIEEYDNPLPAWWMNLFLLSILFSIAYLVAYPGLGSFKGVLGWTQEKQYQAEMQKADAEFLAVYNSFPDKSIEALAKNDKAVKMGQRLFSNNCTVCHGADAGGSRGFPNLRDKDWLYGGSPEQIRETITHGRHGMMPAWGQIIGDEKVHQVANYVKALSEGKGNDASVAAGRDVFASTCAGCHGASGDGNTMVGAPRLNDNIWLYGGDIETIEKSIRDGRGGQMPAHGELLSDERIQLLAAYVYSLSQ